MSQRDASPTMPTLLVFIGCAAVYARTAAPSVMGGDSAEFQMAAPLLGVAHPTTYPLYTLLGKLFALILPFGDLAHRVTLVSAVAAALAVALMLLLARRVTGSLLAGLLAALALACSPGLWNSATMAEVYALLAALIMGLWLALTCVKPAGPRRETGLKPDSAVPCSLFPVHYQPPLLLAALLAGLGVSHHGMFAFTALPLFAVAALRSALATPPASLRARLPTFVARGVLLGIFSIIGLAPWLYPLIQYARFGPFSGEDYGLPRHYFWGAPANWADAIGMLTGGPIRQGAFRLPTFETASAVVQLVGTRLWFEFGPAWCYTWPDWLCRAATPRQANMVRRSLDFCRNAAVSIPAWPRRAGCAGVYAANAAAMGLVDRHWWARSCRCCLARGGPARIT